MVGKESDWVGIMATSHKQEKDSSTVENQ